MVMVEMVESDEIWVMVEMAKSDKQFEDIAVGTC